MTNVYSLTQRWSPIATQEAGEEEVRVHLLALFDEKSGECLAKEMTEVALQPLELALWAAEALPSPLPLGTRILLDDANLLGPLSLYLRGFEVALATQAEHRDHFFADLTEQMRYFQDTTAYSLLENFGEADCLRFFQLAREYFQAAPWELFGHQIFLEFRDAEAREQVVGVYAPGAEDIGFCFLDGVLSANAPILAAGADRMLQGASRRSRYHGAHDRVQSDLGTNSKQADRVAAAQQGPQAHP